MLRGRRCRSATLLALAMVGLSLAACQDDPTANLVRFAPPPQYALWWSEAEACSGGNGDLSRIRWYRNKDGEPLSRRGNPDGWYDRSGHRIALQSFLVNDPRVVRHEMLHALFPGAGHSRELFFRRCGHVVRCDGDCAIEAGPVPTVGPEVARAASTALDIAIHVSPSSPQASRFDGHFALVVTARNPSDEALMVNFPDSTFVGGIRSFGFRVGEHPGGEEIQFHGFAYDRSAGYFGPRETKRAVFDLRIAAVSGQTTLRPGSYFALGQFGDAVSDTIHFTVGGLP